MIRLGVIGTGYITRAFLGGCKKTGQYVLQAVCSRAKETGEAFAASLGGATVYTDLNAMLADPLVDAVYIATPNSLHVEQSRKALEAGKHVICEKPLATTTEPIRELYRVADENNVVFMEAIMTAHLPQLRVLKDLVKKAGSTQRATLKFKQYSSRYDEFLAGKIAPVFDPAYDGGALGDLGIYTVYTAHLLFGVPHRTTASHTLLANGVDGAGCATLYYDGFAVDLVYSKTDGTDSASEIVGESGTVRLGSVSKLTDMYYNKAYLFGDVDKETLMSHEAGVFARILGGDRTAYDYARQMTLSVYETMENLHKQRRVSV